MTNSNKAHHLYLNRNGSWDGFQYQGLTRCADGSLELIALPQLTGTVTQSVQSAASPSGPSGIAVACDGTVYFSDPACNRIREIVGCDGTVFPLPCIGGNRDKPGRFIAPRGLAIVKNRRALFACDSGNHRVQVFDPENGQLLAILGGSEPGASPGPGSAPGRLNTPWGLATDSASNLYVLDYGNARVQKWNAVGDLVGSFWDKVKAAKCLSQPIDVCAADMQGVTWVFVVEGSDPQVFVFDENGNPVPGADGKPVSIGLGKLQSPLGIAASGDALYVGDNTARRIFQFSLTDVPAFVGEARGYQGPVAALCLDGKGNLWVQAGTSDAPLQLTARGAYAGKGFLWTLQPIQTSRPKVAWQRLKAEIRKLPANAHLDFLVYTSNSPGDAPTVTAGSDDPLTDPKWRQMLLPPSTDLDDLYISGCPATYLWVAAQFSSDGAGTPVLSQVRVQFDRDSYLGYLPAIYRNKAGRPASFGPGNGAPVALAGGSGGGDFLMRFLSLFESFNADVEDEIRAMGRLFDAKATPKKYLAWLAEWLGLEIDENWSDAKAREILGHIFKLYGERGTTAYLQRILKLFGGVDAVIEEPIMNAAWWVLPSTAGASCCDECAGDTSGTPAWQGTQNSLLGFSTMLAAAQPQGAVVGTSAVLDQSHLINVDEFGAPLFRDVAYQFSVLLYRGQLMCPDALPRIQALLDQERPAHTLCQICVVEPRMRIGYQSRVGIDSVVGGPGRSLALGSGQALDDDSVLAGSSDARMGQSRLGLSIRLG
jgi:phage tail-like protein